MLNIEGKTQYYVASILTIIGTTLVFQSNTSAQVFSDSGLSEIGVACSNGTLGGSICWEAFDETERRFVERSQNTYRQRNEKGEGFSFLKFDRDVWHPSSPCAYNICLETRDGSHFLELSPEQAERLRILHYEHWATQ